MVAQEHVTETLKNAIRLDRLAHAYMFTGPRGVGKTTAARIVAKAINCTTPPEDREDPSEPCRQCVSCQSFEEGRNMNIIEIDAASNNKVEDVRDLRETVRIPPQGNRMKVYIIDEVHMLSNAAFNALLKTLEEPPPHAMFIFATTEPHKVLPTIQSRCQRFDFRRIATQESVERLRHICLTEDIAVDEESLMLIARKGDGALRDALSVFDQAVSLCGTTITYPELIAALGVVSADVYFEVTKAIVSGSSADVIMIVDRMVRSGYDLQEFVDGLAEHIRNLMVAISVDDPRLIEATESDRKKLKAHCKDFSESTLLTLIHIVGELSDSLRLSRQPRLRLEMALLRMVSIPNSVDIRSALDKLNKLEKMALTGTIRIEQSPSPEVTPRAHPISNPNAASFDHKKKEPPRRPTIASSEGRTELKPEAASGPEVRPTEKASGRQPTAAASSPAVSEPEEGLGLDFEKDIDTEHILPSAPPPSPRATVEPDMAPSPNDLSLFLDAPAIRSPKQRPDTEAQLVQDEDIMVLEPEESESSEQLHEESHEIRTLKTAWVELVQGVMESEKQLGSFLNQAAIFAFDSKTVFLGVPDDFHAKAIRSERVKLTHRLNDLTGFKIEGIAFRIERSRSEKEVIPASESSIRESLEHLCQNFPAVRALVERFGGEIVW